MAKLTLRQQKAVLVQALRDIVNPIARFRRDADAKGMVISAIAAQIADDPSLLRDFAREALRKVGAQ